MELREYNEIFEIARNKVRETRTESKGLGDFTKFTTYLMINFKTMINQTPSHIAEMIIQGSTMGIVDITKKLKAYQAADKDIASLGNRLLVLEQQNVEEMKKFL